MLILSDADVAKSIDVAQAVNVNRDAFISLSAKDAQVPVRIVLSQGDPRVDTLFKPAHIGDGVGLKVVTSAPANAERGIPTIQGTILLVDKETGVASVLMNANYLTALRTAAGSGAATEYLARDDVENLVVFGAGAQGDLHIRTMLHVRPSIKNIALWNRGRDRAEKLVKTLSEEFTNVSFTVIATADEVSAGVKSADIICTCTGSSTPVFDGSDIKPGTHINCIGAYRPDMQEVDIPTLLACDLLTVDDHASCTVKAGDFAVPIAEGKIKAEDAHEIGHVLADTTGKYDAFKGKTTLFKSVGVAVQDVATGHLVYERAKELGLGTQVEL